MDIRTVIMLSDQPGSVDGVKINLYEQGESYNLPSGKGELGDVFVNQLQCAMFDEDDIAQENNPSVNKRGRGK